MEISQLEVLLDNQKGEESAFRLYQEGRHWEINEIANLFLQTQISDVTRLNEFIANLKYQKSSQVIGVYGERGAGKSTLSSSLLLNHYILGNIDELRYFRYNTSLKNFEELFKLNRNSPKNRAICLDDTIYLVPDLSGSGKVAPFIRTLEDVTKLYGQQPTTLFIYISDAHSVKILQELYDRILYMIGRRDLVPSLPRIPSAQKLENPNEMEVTREFYGKTYAVAGGDIRLYDVGNIFGNVLQEESGLFATNPRLLKFLIKQIKTYSEQMDIRVLKESEIAAEILKGELVTKEGIISYMNNRAGEAFKEFWSDIENIRQKTLSKLQKSSSKFSDKYRTLQDRARLNISLAERIIKGLEGLVITKEESITPTDMDIISRFESIKPDIEVIARYFLSSEYDIKTKIIDVETTLRGMTSEMQSERESLKEASSEVKKSIETHEKKLQNIQKNIDYYKSVLLHSQNLGKYNEIYTQIKNKAHEFVSKQPSLFSMSDIEPIKDLLNNPREVARIILQQRLSHELPIY